VKHYHCERNHQGLGNRIPQPSALNHESTARVRWRIGSEECSVITTGELPDRLRAVFRTVRARATATLSRAARARGTSVPTGDPRTSVAALRSSCGRLLSNISPAEEDKGRQPQWPSSRAPAVSAP
jgi:hypothetical protein